MTVSSTSSTSHNNSAQLQYDLKNATTDAKEVNYIKKEADAAPNHQITAQMAQQLHTAQQNYYTNVTALTSDLGAAGLAPGETAHVADYVNALTNGVNNTSMSLETGNDLDGALKTLGDTPGQFHDRMSQITQANSKLLDVSNALAPNSDPSNAEAVQQAGANTQVNAGDEEPYAAGHDAAPTGTYDLYDTGTPQDSVANPGAALGATTDTQALSGGDAKVLDQIAESIIQGNDSQVS